MKLASKIALLFGMLALSSCGMKLVDLGPAPDLYDLNPQPHFDSAIKPVAWQLLVDEPSATSVLDTDHILVREGANEVKYIAESRWTERVPRLVQSNLVEAFEKSGAIVGVGRTAIGLRGDYALQSELRSFDTVYGGGSPQVEVSITFKLVRQPYAKIIASKAFDEKVPAGSSSMRRIASSYEEALSNILSSVVPWALSEAERDYAERQTRFRGPVNHNPARPPSSPQ